MRYFFGFGSLVNLSSHSFAISGGAMVTGLRRYWVAVPERDFAFLSVRSDPASTIAGLVLNVPPEGQSDLDAREAEYDPIPLAADAVDAGFDTTGLLLETYQARTPPATPEGDKPILQSYLDCVLQGYIQAFGTGGAGAFMSSTEGWERPILQDRDDPVYPRSVTLTDAERGVIDDLLAAYC